MRLIHKIIYIIGLTCIELAIYSLFILVFEYYGFIEFYVGYNLWNLSIMDTWLILICVVFFPLFLTINLIFLKLKILNFKNLEV